MKFDCIVGNPPYKGSLNPLYMKITKLLYEKNMKDNGVMSMINPTALVDNNFVGNTSSEMETALRKEGITKLPTIKLDGTEKTLLKYIEELNELNKGRTVDD